MDIEAWDATIQYYVGILQKLKETFTHMPCTYETDGIDVKEKIAHLHYFVGGCDWWIIEKDMEDEQLQAFGVSRLGSGTPELGYISITELVGLQVKTSSGIPAFVELDFYWEPTKLKDIPELQELLCRFEA